ncbi:hypothetical protein [Nonlabens xiamenensis]|uniref:hypothetical protein n=1 Tax=Nonlabens xiamenensis TaxID=2341043 RepID=UPI000F61426C|nr:hypothetical protein [Nonlabens xiamenensis]
MRIPTIKVKYDQCLTIEVLVEALKTFFQADIVVSTYTGDRAALHKLKLNIAAKIFKDIQFKYNSRKFTGKGSFEFYKYEAEIIYDGLLKMETTHQQMQLRQRELIDNLIQEIFDIETKNPWTAAFDLFQIGVK